METLPAPAWRETLVSDGSPAVKDVEIDSESFLALFYSKSQVKEFKANCDNLLKFADSKYQTIAVQHLFETPRDYVIVCEKASLLSRQAELGHDDFPAEDVLAATEELLCILQKLHEAKVAGPTLQPSKLALKEEESPMFRLLDLAQLKTATSELKQKDINALGKMMASIALGNEHFDTQNLQPLLERKFGPEGSVLHELFSAMMKNSPSSATVLLDDINNQIKKKMKAAQNSMVSIDSPHHIPNSPNAFSPQPAYLSGFEESKGSSFPQPQSHHREVYYLEEGAAGPFAFCPFDPTEVTKSFRFAVEWLKHDQRKFAKRHLCDFMQTLADSSRRVKVRLNAVPLMCNLCKNSKERKALFRMVCLHYTCADCLTGVASSPRECVCRTPIQLLEKEKAQLPPRARQAYAYYEWQLS